jgi:hypothetical protein
MVTKRNDKEGKYADFVYVLSDTERDEALWLIKQGDFKDLNDFIESSRRAQINIWLRADAEKERKAQLRKARRVATKDKNKAA